MRLKRAWLLSIITTTILQQTTEAGILKTLEGELETLVSKTEPYLVTVRGDCGWRNLVATGIVIDASGYLVTSSQVYEATRFEVTFKNGISYQATKIGVDNLTGLAVLKINGGKFLPPAWGRAKDVKKGSWITVVGNSYNIPATIYFGSYAGLTDEGLLRLAVNANPGASGGAVLDIDGNLIGVLVARESNTQSGDSTYWASPDPGTAMLLRSLGAAGGRCYAVPLDMVLDIAAILIKDGKIARGYLGIASQNQQIKIQQGEKIGRGVRITALETDSPAGKAGLQKNDIIVSLDSQPIPNRASLIAAIRAHRPGDSIQIEYTRQNQKLKAVAQLAEINDTPFMSGLELPQAMPASAASAKASSGPSDAISAELAKLHFEIQRLQIELRDLRKELAK